VPSLKAMKYEEALLNHTAVLKSLVLKAVGDDSSAVQNFLTEINGIFKTAHEEGRKLRKALAFLHGANDSYKKQLADNDIEPNEFYGREDGQSGS
jgi:hypothetical protein